MKIKCVIAGSRDIKDTKYVYSAIKESGISELIGTVISGGCRGVDAIGEAWAAEHNIPVEVYPADWDKYGKAAGPLRNQHMAQVADYAIVIHFQASKGSKNMIAEMKALNKPVFVKVIDE